MPTLTLHYNASCPDCARQASRTARFDWLGRIALSTDLPPIRRIVGSRNPGCNGDACEV